MDHHEMNRAELEEILKRLHYDLEDLQETISFNLMFSANHIGGNQVRKDEERITTLKEEIAKVEEMLKKEEE